MSPSWTALGPRESSKKFIHNRQNGKQMNAKHFENALILLVNDQVLKFEIRNFIRCTNSFSIIIKNVIVNAVFTVRFKINIQNDFFMWKEIPISLNFLVWLPMVVVDLSVVIWFNYLPYKLRYSMKSKKSFTNTWCSLIHSLP